MTAPEPPADLERLPWRLPIAVFRTSSDGRFLAGNSKLLSLLGADSMEDLRATNVGDMYVDPAQRADMIRRANADMPIPPEEIALRRLDGTTIWVRVSSQPVKNDAGELVHFEGVIEDITARKQAVENLALSNRLLDAVAAAQNRFLTGADVGVVFDDLLEGLLTLTSSEYGFIAEVYGAGEGRFIRTLAITNIAWDAASREQWEEFGPRGMEFHNLDTLFGRVVTEAHPIVSNNPDSDARAGGAPTGHPPLDSFLGVPVFGGSDVIAMVAVANRPGGYDLEVAHALDPFLSTVGSLLLAVRDHQARIDAEERERVRDQRFKAVVEAAVDAVVVFDESGTIEAFNPAAEQLFGYDAAEIVGRCVRELTADAGDWSDTADAAGPPMEIDVVHRSGDSFPAEVTVGEFRDNGRMTITAVVRDITERKVTEDALRRAKEAAERTSRAKDEFLTAMSHELRTPLNGVIGLSSILNRETHGPLNDKQHEYLTQIEASGKHLLDVINDVLDLAKIEADRFEPMFGAVDLRAVAGQAVGMVRESAAAKGLTIESDLDSHLPVVRADERRTRQVLVNLLSNAIKFTDGGGRIGITAGLDGRAVVVRVWDTGIGIDADRIEEVFVPFQQLDASLNRQHEGTGLGLALSRRLIEMQGGSMSLQSRPGEGSEFTFRLPVDPAGGVPADPAAVPDRRTGARGQIRGRVLVVEDNDVNRMLIADYLEAHDLEVAIARDGNEAITQAIDFEPHVILMDVQMPRRDGLSATRELKAQEATQHIPVIALTALAMKGDADRCLAAGCSEYLSKPCDPAMVLRVVGRYLTAPPE